MHGSEGTWRKFLNAAAMFKVNVAICGGDLTGKMIVPIVERADGKYTYYHLKKTHMIDADKLDKAIKEIKGIGYYPYVTTEREYKEMVENPKKVDEVLLVFKAFVTRVGKGPLEGEIDREEALKRGWLEKATVTGRERRAAPFNFNLASRAVMLNTPTQLVITKLDILYPECTGVRSFGELSLEARRFIREIEEKLKVPVTLIGTGPNVEDVIDRRL